MSMATAIMDFVLMALLVAALWFGVRLDKRLKTLRAAHDDFAKAVHDLDQAAIRAHTSLRELRAHADESQDLLHGRILAGRDLLQKLETLSARAERTQRELENGVNAANILQNLRQETLRTQPAIAPEPAPRRVQPVQQTVPQPLAPPAADSYNPAWGTPSAQTAPQPQAPAQPARRPFDRDQIRADQAAPQPRHTPAARTAPPQSLLPEALPDADEAEILDKVQMSELVVANLNEMIRSFAVPRVPVSLEDDLFGANTPVKKT